MAWISRRQLWSKCHSAVPDLGADIMRLSCCRGEGKRLTDPRVGLVLPVAALMVLALVLPGHRNTRAAALSTAVTPTPEPTPTLLAVPTMQAEVTVISVRVEKAGSKADSTLSHPSLKRVSVGSTVELSIYYTVQNGARTHKVTDIWRLKLGTRAMLKRIVSHRLHMPAPGLYRDHLSYQLRDPGAYTYVGRVRIGGFSRAGITRVRAVRR